ncbi:type I secretion system permease/ATPase [Kordiimonas sp. SCSIO 12610]|uniref:type I secretion system permease/ATPase n=1 Tax=Kordiimonas sp. SCSIO 12610 TaxID=2829597 RepID=UPI00210D22C0|nr:type I secretion system permease/ATPase [Kordiimonas sp. SCSIO 12610]UTW55855.1 type I secretion system permease/ATPase [Kordiimonas sp. SCSIO 12610]
MKDILESKAVKDAIAEQTSPFVTITKACKKSLKWAAIFSLILNLLQLTVPIYMMTMLDKILSSGNENSLYLLTLIAISALTVAALLDVIRSQVLNRAASWLETKLGVHIFEEVALAHHKGKIGNATGLEELWRLRSFMSSPAILAIFDIPWMIFYLIVLFLLSVPIGIIATIGAAILFAIAFMSEHSIRKHLEKGHGHTEDSRDYMRVVQKSSETLMAMGMMEPLRRRWLKLNIKALQGQYISAGRASINLAGFRFFRMLLQISVLFAGGLLVINGAETPGIIIGASLIMSRALAPVEQAITAWKQAMSARAAYHKLSTILPDSVEQTVSARKPEGIVEIRLEDTSYTFPNTEAPFIRNVNLTAKPGEVLSLIGPSASGKSTLAKLIAGAHSPSEGFIYIGDYEVSHFSRDELGPMIGFVPQQIDFLPGTIAENIARFRDIPIEDVVEAARRINAHDDIMQLPMGYETCIGGDMGHPLSGGQIQRLAIARALCGEPRILIMDEPNLNLDTATEAKLLEVMEEEKQRGTNVIIVSHHQEFIKRADKIAMISRGKISQFGNRSQVLRRLNTPTLPKVGTTNITRKKVPQKLKSKPDSDKPASAPKRASLANMRIPRSPDQDPLKGRQEEGNHD